ncbi:MAG TPA: serine hydrolase [Acidimicrobiales bacterium]|nr:serine hydrolase [Acidimicrobiales bacterium]
MGAVGQSRLVELVELPTQPAGVPWPTTEWPTGSVPSGVDLDGLMDRMFDDTGPLGLTFAVLVIHGGRLVFERYAGELAHFDRPSDPVGAESRLISWSMAKSMLHAVVGMLVAEGRLNLDVPVNVPEWSPPGDPRGAITLRQMLAMRDGLAWAEVYEDASGSDVIEMLFGSGQSDIAHFAADRPLAVPPGTRFNYSSGTSNIISRVVAQVVGTGEAYRAFLSERLFGPIGMTSAEPEFDPTGIWIASSNVMATARDFARFGLLYLRGGVWDGTRLLPEGWVDYARTMVSDDPDDGPYGAHWWGLAGDQLGTFRASGYEGQSILISPCHDVVMVRLGKTPESDEGKAALDRWRRDFLEAFAPA